MHYYYLGTIVLLLAAAIFLTAFVEDFEDSAVSATAWVSLFLAAVIVTVMHFKEAHDNKKWLVDKQIIFYNSRGKLTAHSSLSREIARKLNVCVKDIKVEIKSGTKDVPK